MDKNLLIVTSEPNFSELLRQALGQAGYRVLTAKTKGEAIFRADEENCALAFLDLDMGQKAVADIGRALRMLNPNFKLVLFSGTDPPPALDEIRPWVSLRKPFYLPDLLNMLNGKSAPVAMPSAPVPVSQPAKVGKAGASIPFGNTAMPWLDDVTKAAQHLTRLTLESSAQAALITRGDDLWAYAGQLSQAAAKELAVTVTRHWEPREVQVAGYKIDLDRLTGAGPRGSLALTALEADLLELRTAEPNTVHSRAELLERVWGYRSDVETRTVDNFIVRLRRYFEEEPEEPRHFISVRGRGYMYVP